MDLNSRQCKQDGCRKQPVFGDASVGRMIYCKEHKKPHHVDIRGSRYDSTVEIRIQK